MLRKAITQSQAALLPRVTFEALVSRTADSEVRKAMESSRYLVVTEVPGITV